MLTQKLYRSGNSVAVTILKEGKSVIVEKRGQELVVTPKKEASAPGVDQKFARMVDEFINGHEDVLQELSRK